MREHRTPPAHLLLTALLLGAAAPGPVHAQQASSVGNSATSAGGFSAIVEEHTRKAFQAVSEYVTKNPAAPDAESAHRWFFETAQANGLEADAVAIAEQYLKRDDGEQETRDLGRQVLSLGLAKSGKMKEAVAEFDRRLKSVRLRSPNDTVDFAMALVAQAQLAGDAEAAREILGRLAEAFFLNPYVRQLSDSKLMKLELVQRPAPAINVDDLDGKRVDLADLEGKVVLVDFWATNCPPCLEEFPKMKQLYADFRDKGFEIVGISLDEDPEEIAAFQRKSKLPWRLVHSEARIEELRERYRVPTIPALYLVDQKGRVAYVDLRGKDLRSAVERLLK
jgi:peroxiredoxin